MDASNDDTLTREEAKALIVFLIAEKKRHYNDIVKINEAIARVIDRYKISRKEQLELWKKSERYVHF